MPEGRTREISRTPANQIAAVSAGCCLPILFVGAMLAAMAVPIDIAGDGGWISVKSAFASHDNANNNGRGHNGDGGGNSGGAGSGGGTGDDRDDGPGIGGTGAGGAGGNGRAEAATAEDRALGEAIGAVESVEAAGPPTADAATGLPTIREIFTLPEDAVIGAEEERALIASGWNPR